MKKKYYLYHQTRTILMGLTWAFWDKYDSHEEALAKMDEQAGKGVWLVWKIEEVWEVDPGYRGYTNLMP